MGKQILNGVIYGTGEIIKFSPEIYSFEEREVGVWTDGKPLYEKTICQNNIAMGYLPTATPPVQTQVAHGVSDIGEITYLQICCPVLGIITKETLFTNGTVMADFRVNNTYIQAVAGNNYFGATSDRYWYFTLQYTKTTDSPGSGHYTTNGGESHHYSTTEQVIGTWIDGKPLYEKTLQFTLDSTKTGNWVSFNHGISNIDKIVNASSFAANDNGIYYNAIRFASYSSYSSYVQAGGSFSLVAASRVDVGFQIGSDIPSSYNKIYVIIQYTKTTD